MNRTKKGSFTLTWVREDTIGTSIDTTKNRATEEGEWEERR